MTLKGILIGAFTQVRSLVMVFSHGFRKRDTLQYPEEPVNPPPRQSAKSTSTTAAITASGSRQRTGSATISASVTQGDGAVGSPQKPAPGDAAGGLGLPVEGNPPLAMMLLPLGNKRRPRRSNSARRLPM